MIDAAARVVPDVVRRRYALKFGIALVLLGLSVGVIGIVATQAITSDTKDSVEGELETLAASEAGNLQSWSEANERTVRQFSQSSILAEGNDPEVQSFLDTRQDGLESDFDQLHLVDLSTGEIVHSSDRTREGKDISTIGFEDEAVFDDPERYAGTLVLRSDVFRTESTTQGTTRSIRAISYGERLAGNDDRAIVFTSTLEDYPLQFESAGDDRLLTLVVNRNHEVILDDRRGSSPETYLQPYGNPAHEKRFDAAFEGSDPSANTGAITRTEPRGAVETEFYQFPNDPYVMGYAQVAPQQNGDWIVVIKQPVEDAYGPVERVRTYGSGATILGVLLIGLVGTILGRTTARAIDQLTTKAERIEDGDLDVEFETNRIDSIGRLYDGFDTMQTSLRQTIDELETARENAVAERTRVKRINEELESAAVEYSTVMEAAAGGDLTVRANPSVDHDTMRAIGEDVNQMLEEIESAIHELGAFARVVADASEEVTGSSEEVRSASQNIAAAIQKISESADRQNSSLQAANDEMADLSSTIEAVAASSNRVADIAERTAITGRDGREAAETAIRGIEEIEAESNRALEEMRQLESEVAQIDELVERIQEIASKTNMLALNANIEASRSESIDGDVEGFNVVAAEVKELSADAKEAAEEIERRLDELRQQTERSADEVESTSDHISSASGQVQDAVEALELIAQYAEETNDGIQDISEATKQQAASTQEVVAMVDEAATVSEETTDAARTVAAATQEQTKAIERVSTSVSDLSQQATHLSAALDRFQTDANLWRE
jgi:methyl-accepting chemotaxis protein